MYIAAVLSSFAFTGFVVNGSLMLTSSRTIKEEQTKNQANMGIAINVGALIGVGQFNLPLIDP